MSVELTKRERECLDHLQTAEGLGVTLKEYADAYGVDVNFLYNAKSQLVKKGGAARRQGEAGRLWRR